MQIQRIQTLLILVAIAAIAVFIFVPYGYWDAQIAGSAPEFGPLIAKSQPALLVPSIVALVVMAISIFLYNRMPLQKSFVVISVLIVLAMICVVIYMLTRTYVDPADPQLMVRPLWGMSIALLAAAVAALIIAYRSISADQKLLRSYDRLR